MRVQLRFDPANVTLKACNASRACRITLKPLSVSKAAVSDDTCLSTVAEGGNQIMILSQLEYE